LDITGKHKKTAVSRETAVMKRCEIMPYQQVLQEEPHELGCIPESTKP
jgi:hypothetical protein